MTREEAISVLQDKSHFDTSVYGYEAIDMAIEALQEPKKEKAVLVRNMKMPRDCPMCPLAHWNKADNFTGCEIVGGKKYAVKEDEEYARSSGRPEWCPLEERIIF